MASFSLTTYSTRPGHTRHDRVMAITAPAIHWMMNDGIYASPAGSENRSYRQHMNITSLELPIWLSFDFEGLHS